MSTYNCNLTRLGLALLLAAVALASSGCVTCCPRITAQPSGAPANEIVQEFPTSGPVQTAWKVRFAHGPGKGLYITGAWFKRSPAEAWMRVLYDARLADIFVPYHPGNPRFYDLSVFNFDVMPAVAADTGCCGKIIDSVVVKEVRDRGLAWKDHNEVHRGQELILWSAVNAANYNYIIQYGFRDDGTITFRLGATARNLPGREFIAHMHDGLWRVDIDLNGAGNDSVKIMSHTETTTAPTATDNSVDFNGGREGSADWNPLEFTELEVIDTVRKNSHGRNIAYDLMPVRAGSSRHQEDFSHHDFWVTRYHAGELSYSALPTYVSNGESVTNTDVVLWHVSPVHHLPRDEDGEYQASTWVGSALVMWGGFDLRPRNLFDRTPLYP